MTIAFVSPDVLYTLMREKIEKLGYCVAPYNTFRQFGEDDDPADYWVIFHQGDDPSGFYDRMCEVFGAENVDESPGVSVIKKLDDPGTMPIDCFRLRSHEQDGVILNLVEDIWNAE